MSRVPRKKKQPRSKATGADRPKRPLSAYNHFFREERKKWVKEEGHGDGTLTSRKRFSKMGRDISQRWWSLAEEEKSVYKEMAAESYEAWKIAMEEYRAKKAAQGGTEAPSSSPPSSPESTTSSVMSSKLNPTNNTTGSVTSSSCFTVVAETARSNSPSIAADHHAAAATQGSLQAYLLLQQQHQLQQEASLQLLQRQLQQQPVLSSTAAATTPLLGGNALALPLPAVPHTMLSSHALSAAALPLGANSLQQYPSRLPLPSLLSVATPAGLLPTLSTPTSLPSLASVSNHQTTLSHLLLLQQQEEHRKALFLREQDQNNLQGLLNQQNIRRQLGSKGGF